MNEMIKRVARKLEPQAWAALGTGDTLAYSNRRTSSIRKARAAIEAMRDPTGDMAPPAYAAFDKAEPDGIMGPNGLLAVWRAMIDQALK